MHLDRAAMAALQTSMADAESAAAGIAAEIDALLTEARSALGSGRLAEAFTHGFGERCDSASTELARVVTAIGTHRAALGAVNTIVVAADEATR